MPEQIKQNPEGKLEDNQMPNDAAKDYYGNDIPEFNPTRTKILAQSGFNERHKDIVESSFAKARESGEKLHGNNNERRSEAYLNRIENLVAKHGNATEQRLWQMSANRLIVKAEDIPEAYWQQQEQIYRDQGYGNIHMGEHNREIITQDIQKKQRESLESWSDYLGDENSPYPMWFKVYAWDGMSKMGTFDKEKRHFQKRDKSTVAPYPKCNPAVLAQVYGLIEDFYSNNPSERYADDETKQAEMQALVKSGNFNKLYSKVLLEQKAIPKTPERTEDVHGQWVEYRPGQEKEIASAAEGTPWCVADPGTARSYLQYGKYGHANDDDSYDSYISESNHARFMLFHLEDPETNTLAESACASIRLDQNGNVAEISGLKDGQALEDSLVPIVEEKVKTLPGGEHFLKAFADKKQLIALDRKMQNNEPLTKDEYEFVYEINRDIVTLDTYNNSDPRIKELRQKYGLEDAFAAGINPTVFAEKCDSSVVAVNLDTFFAAGADPNVLAKNCFPSVIAKHLEEFFAAGADPTALAEKCNPDIVVKNLDGFIAAGADIYPKVLAMKCDFRNIAENIDRFVAMGADPTEIIRICRAGRDDITGKIISKLIAVGVDPAVLVRKCSPNIVANNLDELLAAGADIDPTALAEECGPYVVASNLEKFMVAGADIDVAELADKCDSETIAYNLDELLAAGADIDPTALAEECEPYVVANDLEKFMAAGADIDVAELVDKCDSETIAYNLDKFIVAGADVDLTRLAEKCDSDIIIDNLDKFIVAGASPDMLVKRFNANQIAANLDKLITAGADIDPVALAKKCTSDTIAANLDKLIAAGADIDPTLLAEKCAPHVVAYSLDRFITAGADINYVKLVNDCDSYTVVQTLDKFIASGVDPIMLAQKCGSSYIVDNINKFIAAGADPSELAKSCHLYDVAKNLDKFIAAGADIDPTVLATECTPNCVAYNLDKFIAAGADIDPTVLATECTPNCVTNNFEKFVAAGADEDTLNRMLNM